MLLLFASVVLHAGAQDIVVRPKETCSSAEVIVGTGSQAGLCIAFKRSPDAMPQTYNVTLIPVNPRPGQQNQLTPSVNCNQAPPGSLPYKTLALTGKQGTFTNCPPSTVL